MAVIIYSIKKVDIANKKARIYRAFLFIKKLLCAALKIWILEFNLKFNALFFVYILTILINSLPMHSINTTSFV